VARFYGPRCKYFSSFLNGKITGKQEKRYVGRNKYKKKGKNVKKSEFLTTLKKPVYVNL